MKQVKVADFVMSYLEGLGVRKIFMISGGGNMHLIDSAGKAKKMQYVCNHHEQACAIAAETYARVTKTIGVCLVTTGPGATNAITGVSGGWLDSIPMLALSGQIPTTQMITKPTMRQIGVQEINIIDIVKPMTKYAAVITKAADILYYLQKAVYLAQTGRPGPSWLDIPLDIQGAYVDPTTLRSFDPKAEGLETKHNANLSKLVAQIISELKRAKQPLILAGHGIRIADARETFAHLIKKLGVPITTTISAPDLITTNDPLFAGRPGGFGDRAGNFAVQNCDLLLTIGARLHPWTTGFKSHDFGRRAKKIMVDIDPDELNKHTLSIDLKIEADAKEFMIELMKQLSGAKLPKYSQWQSRCQAWNKRYPVMLAEYKTQKKYVNSYYFVDELSKQMKPGELIVTGDGTAFTGTNQAIKIKPKQHVIFSVGCAAMGYDLPAAIGACFGSDKQRTILITGDGSIMLNIQELQTIYHHKLPIKIFLLNNNGYLAIRNTQNNYFKGNLVASGPESGVSLPDFKDIAKAFKIPYVQMSKSSEVPEKIRQTLAVKGPIICEIMMSPDQELNPKPRSIINPDGSFVNKPLEDMYPYLDRQEFEENIKNN